MFMQPPRLDGAVRVDVEMMLTTGIWVRVLPPAAS